MIPRTIHDVPVLSPLVRAVERLGVDLVVFGSAASRAALLHAAGKPPRDLFEISEHASDIDIAHTGPPALTQRLRAEIEREIPLAPWVRWSIIDSIGWKVYETQKRMNLEVPLRQVQLSTHPSLSLPQEEAVEKATEGVVEFIWNDAFGSSPRAAYDTEVSAALMYFDAMADVATVGGLRISELQTSLQVARRAFNTGLKRLAEIRSDQANLAARRIWYRFAALAMRGKFGPDELSSGMRFFLDYVTEMPFRSGYSGPIDALRRDPLRPFALSAATVGGGFRFDPVWEHKIETGETAYATFRRSANMIAGGDEPYKLADGDKILRGITDLRVRRADAPSEAVVGALAQEFLHVSVDIEDTAPYLQEDLTAMVIGHGPRGSALLPAFVIVSKAALSYMSINGCCPMGNRTTIRMNLARMLDDIDRIDVFLVGREEIRAC